MVTVRAGAQAASQAAKTTSRASRRFMGPSLLSELLHVGVLGRLEVEDRVGEALVHFGVAEDDLVHVALRVGDDAREHAAVLADHEEQLRYAGDGLERIELERVARGKIFPRRDGFRGEFLEQIAFAPE